MTLARLMTLTSAASCRNGRARCMARAASMLPFQPIATRAGATSVLQSGGSSRQGSRLTGMVSSRMLNRWAPVAMSRSITAMSCHAPSILSVSGMLAWVTTQVTLAPRECRGTCRGQFSYGVFISPT